MLYSVEILYFSSGSLLNQGVYNTDHQSKTGYFFLIANHEHTVSPFWVQLLIFPKQFFFTLVGQ